MPTRTGYLEVNGRRFPFKRVGANYAGCLCAQNGFNECQPECGRFTEACPGCGRRVALGPDDGTCGRCTRAED
jgi:hypothetical protein